jgi:FKBP-type peptidyl-prolyl cis-trans isomerase
VARIEHGQIFDSSGGAPKAVRVRSLIPGWADAVKSMTVGSRWVVWIPANRAFVGNTPLRGKAVKIDMRLVRILR